MVKDLSHLPTKAPEPEGIPPSADPQYVTILVEELAAQPPKPQVADTVTRHSSAGSCLRQVAIIRDGHTPTPMDLPGYHVTNIGTLIHEAWQDAVARRHPDAQFEVPSVIEDLTSGSCDVLLPSERHVLELKTEGEYGWDVIAGIKGQPPGPKRQHLIQLALNVVGLDAQHGTLVYMRRSAHSVGGARRFKLDEVGRFGLEFRFDRETLQPYADEWLELVRYVRDHPTEEVGRHVPGMMPPGARLDPTSGAWTLVRDGEVLDSGEFWSKGAGCRDYCKVRDVCVAQWEDGK